ncbi:kinasehypothetical proteinlike protein [Bipolaris maydis]|nr:kinasehypothetical proteinlike protein [Bipolaris maydis]
MSYSQWQEEVLRVINYADVDVWRTGIKRETQQDQVIWFDTRDARYTFINSAETRFDDADFHVVDGECKEYHAHVTLDWRRLMTMLFAEENVVRKRLGSGTLSFWEYAEQRIRNILRTYHHEERWRLYHHGDHPCLYVHFPPRQFDPLSINNLPTYWSTHSCDIDAEPLHRYQWGGYHPVHLGDYLKNGRYKILHKLGWSGYSTTDGSARNRAFVAIKVCVSKTTQHSRELAVLGAMAAARPNQPGYQCLMTMQDYFQIHGPARLSGMLAKVIAKQTLTGLSFLHKHNIAHADLHTRNLAFTIPSIHDLHEEHLLQKLGQPETGRVQRTDRKPLEPNLPAYLVRPASYPINIKSSFDTIKIVHFGQSFFNNDSPGAFHTPLYYRAPEIIFNDNVDHRVDL